MGKASRTKQGPDRRARIAAQRAAERRRQQLKRIYLAGGSILVVAIVVIALVLVKLNSGSGTTGNTSNGPAGSSLAAVTKQVTGVPASVTDKVAAGGVPKGIFVSAHTSSAVQSAASQLGSYFATVNGKALTANGKPEVLYIGAEFCPYCAAQRWAMINALSRFGTFTGLTTVHSSSTDQPPDVPTWTFYGSKYTSKYITFTSVEETKNYRIGHSTNTSVAYVTLQKPTSAQNQLVSAYDPGQSIPFMDLGNKYVQVGNLSPLSPQMLAGLSWSKIAADMNNPNSSLGKAEIGNANYMTAGICELTGNQPASACTPTIKTLEGDLAK